MTKMTKRDYFNDIKALALAEDRGDIAEFCDRQIELLDSKAAKAKEASAKRKAEGDELTDAIFAVLTEDFVSIPDIAAKVEGADITVSKVQYRLNAMAKAEKIRKGEITIPGVDGGKARKAVAYAL